MKHDRSIGSDGLAPDPADHKDVLKTESPVDDELWASDQFLEAEVEQDEQEGGEVSAGESPVIDVEDDSMAGDADTMGRYLREVRSFRLLNREEEIELAQRIEEGEWRIVEESFSSLLALRWTLELGNRVEAGEVRTRDVVKLRVKTSGEHISDERVLRARFHAGLRKLRSMAANFSSATAQSESSTSAARQRNLLARISRRNGKIAALIQALELNPQQIERLINKHKEIYDRAKTLTAKSERSPEPCKEVAALEKSIGMSIQELGRKVATIVDKKAQVKLAKHHFVQSNLRLVAALAKKYCGRGLSYSDLIQEGNIGLMKAVDKFDHQLGFRFSTYASWWVRQAMSRSITDHGHTIRIPVHIVELSNKLNSTVAALGRQLGRTPSEEEIGAYMAVPAANVRTVLSLVRQPVSLETPAPGDGDGCLGDIIKDERNPDLETLVMDVRCREEIHRTLKKLSPREEKIIRMRFGIREKMEHTLEETGFIFGVTRERIRQIEAVALRKLRHRDSFVSFPKENAPYPIPRPLN